MPKSSATGPSLNTGGPGCPCVSQRVWRHVLEADSPDSVLERRAIRAAIPQDELAIEANRALATAVSAGRRGPVRTASAMF